MPTIESMTVKLTANTAQFKKGMEEGRHSVRSFVRELKQVTGKGSMLGQLVTIGAGGGAIAGVTMALSHMQEGVRKLTEIEQEFAKGEITSSQATGLRVAALVKAIPVMGQVADLTAESIRLALGMAASDAQASAALEDYTKRQEQFAKAIDAGIAMRKIGSDAEDMQRNLLGMFDSLWSTDLEKQTSSFISSLDASAKKLGDERQKLTDVLKGVDIGPAERSTFEDQVAKIEAAQRTLAQQRAAVPQQVETKRVQGISEYVDSLMDERAALSGTAAQIQQRAAAIRNATATERAAIEVIMLDTEALRQQMATQEAAEAIIKDLNLQTSLMGKTAGDAARIRAAFGGIVDTDTLRIISDAADKLKEMQDQAAEVEQIKQFGKSITNDVMTPMEQYTKQIEDLQEALDAGAITQEIFARATQKAREALTGAGRASQLGMFELKGMRSRGAAGTDTGVAWRGVAGLTQSGIMRDWLDQDAGRTSRPSWMDPANNDNSTGTNRDPALAVLEQIARNTGALLN